MNPFLRGATPPAPVVNIGHRGGATAPENTLAAFAAALEAGAHAVECDLRTARDGAVIVVHDETLKRTAGQDRRVDELTLDELRRLDPAVPTLRETLDLIRSRSAYVNLEIKAADVEAVVRQVREAEMVDRVILSSFDHGWVAEAKRLEPQVAVSALLEKPVRDAGRLARESIQADLIAPGREIATRELFASARRHGIGVHVWTVNDPAEMEGLIAAGASGLFTDHPDRLRKVLRGA